MEKPVVILGAGGHGRVLIDTLQILSAKIIGITDPDTSLHGQCIMGIPVLGNDDMVLEYHSEQIRLINGLGLVNRSNKRQQVYELFRQRGYQFASVIHPTAIISGYAHIEEGVQVMTGAVVQASSTIAANSIINTHACIDHDCVIGKHVHIAPGVTISGGVTIGEGTLVGAGATIIQGIKIGSNCIVAAGAVVTHDVRSGTLVRGVPAREVRKDERLA